MTPVCMVHVINGLEVMSGAELALARIVNAQLQRPLRVISLTRISEESRAKFRGDVELVTMAGRFGLIGAAIRLAKYFYEMSPATVVSWMYRANFVATLALLSAGRRHRLIWNIRHFPKQLSKEPLRVRISLWLNKIASCLPSKIIYVSNRAREYHQDVLGFDGRSSMTIPNGFVSMEIPSKPRSELDRFVIGHAGRNTWEKDVDTLLRGFSLAKAKAAKKLSLVLAGRDYASSNGSLCEKLKMYGIDRGDVILMGHVSDMSKFYGLLDIFVLTSVCEAFPNVLVEANLCGVPCITTDVGDATEVVTRESGWIIPIRDPARLAEALLHASNLGRDSMSALGSNGHKHVVTNYRIEEIARKYDALVLRNG